MKKLSLILTGLVLFGGMSFARPVVKQEKKEVKTEKKEVKADKKVVKADKKVVKADKKTGKKAAK